MLQRTFIQEIEEEGGENVVFYVFQGENIAYCCSKIAWEIYELEKEILEKGATEENIDLLKRKVYNYCKETENKE